MPKAKFPVVDIHSHTGPTPQTIDQRKLYGTHVHLFQELPVPAACAENACASP
mgnify:CR=1 FL=1